MVRVRVRVGLGHGTRAKPGVLLVYIISGLRLSVCVFAIHAQTADPIATKLGGKIEEHLGRNLRLLPSERVARARRARSASPTKLGGKLEEHLGRNLGLLPSEREARAASAKRESCPIVTKFGVDLELSLIHISEPTRRS